MFFGGIFLDHVVRKRIICHSSLASWESGSVRRICNEQATWCCALGILNRDQKQVDCFSLTRHKHLWRAHPPQATSCLSKCLCLILSKLGLRFCFLQKKILNAQLALLNQRLYIFWRSQNHTPKIFKIWKKPTYVCPEYVQAFLRLFYLKQYIIAPTDVAFALC